VEPLHAYEMHHWCLAAVNPRDLRCRSTQGRSHRLVELDPHTGPGRLAVCRSKISIHTNEVVNSQVGGSMRLRVHKFVPKPWHGALTLSFLLNRCFWSWGGALDRHRQLIYGTVMPTHWNNTWHLLHTKTLVLRSIHLQATVLPITVPFCRLRCWLESMV